MNATSSKVALFVVGLCVFGAGAMMLRAAFLARLAYARAKRTRRRVTGVVTGNRTDSDGESIVYSPIVRYTDPRSGKTATFSPTMFASRQFAEGRQVRVLYDDRGREPILDERPFRAGFAGHPLFIFLALMCFGCGLLAIVAIAGV